MKEVVVILHARQMRFVLILTGSRQFPRVHMSLPYVFILPCSAACKGKLGDHSGAVEDCNEVNSFSSLACILKKCNKTLQPNGL